MDSSGQAESFKMLVENVRDYAIFLMDTQGRIQTWNPGAERIKGYSQEDILGKNYSTFYPQEDREKGVPEKQLELAARDGRIEREGWRLRKDGSRFWANVVITAVRDHEGRLMGFAKITRDMTERKRAEEALAAALRDLRRANRELEDYAAFAAHDLQEPLRKVTSFATLLDARYADRLDDTARGYIRTIVASANRLRRLIADLLRYARTGHAQAAADAEAVDLDEVFAQALSDLETAVQESGAEVSVGKLPAVKGSGVLLRQLAGNLLSNALKYRSPDRRPEVEVSARREGGQWVVSVRDNGIGFEPALAGEIFAPFRRLQPKHKYPGSGLGLAECKKIVELYGGRIWAQSEPDKGSTFSFSLPAA